MRLKVKFDETRDLLLKSIREVFDVARDIGVDIAEENVESTINFMDQLPPDGIASMQRDIWEGRPSELDEQCGTAVRLYVNIMDFFHVLTLLCGGRNKI